MSYTKRTCARCGFRDIQPNMKQVTESYTSGYSQKAISGRSIVGAFLGDPRAQRQNAGWLVGSTKRKYTRNRQVWVCKSNCGNKTTSPKSPPTPTEYVSPKGLPRNVLPKLDELKEGDCRAEFFYESVGKLDYSERTAAENALITAYLDWSLSELETWYERVLSFAWYWLKKAFVAVSLLLWLLVLASFAGVI